MTPRIQHYASVIRNVPILLFSFWLITTIAGCAPEDDGNEGRRILNRGLTGDPESLDPHQYSSTQAAIVLRDLGEGLVSYSRTGNLVGGVASEWKVSEDQLEYTFTIRPDARWSNGESVTAFDFELSYRRLVLPSVGSPSAKNLSVIKNADKIISGQLHYSDLAAKALNRTTLTITLESPTPYFLQLLAHPSTFPVYFDRTTIDDSERVEPDLNISNGPYSLAQRVLGSSITLKRNKYYWDDEETWFDKVVYHSLSPAVEVLRYRAGELDITSGIDPGSFELLKKELSNELKIDSYLGIYYYGFNLKRPPFGGSRALRKAMSMAIDRIAIVESITGRGEQPAYALVPPGVDNYKSGDLDFRYMSKQEREEEAKRLYAAAGYGTHMPLEFELRYNTAGGHEKIAVAIQSMWKQVLGAEAHLVGEEFKVFIDNVMEMRVTEAFRLSWTGDFNDPYSFLQLVESGNANNLTGYANSEVDELLKKAGLTGDPASRRDYLQEAEQLALNDHALIPIYFFVSKHLVKPDIVGWTPNILDFHFSKFLSRKERPE